MGLWARVPSGLGWGHVELLPAQTFHVSDYRSVPSVASSLGTLSIVRVDPCALISEDAVFPPVNFISLSSSAAFWEHSTRISALSPIPFPHVNSAFHAPPPALTILVLLLP